MTTINRRPLAALASAAIVLTALSQISCESSDAPADPPAQPALLTEAQLMDPQTCAQCHPTHVKQWSMSMHAYAAEDPIFLAMNRRAQRETGGAVGSFCINCHAPIAVRTGATKDGLNIADVPRHLRGITCYACHTASAINASHNSAIDLGDDGVLRGPIADPVSSTHRSTYSPLHDRDRIDSSSLCGSCHDIRTPQGADIATTFAEWKGSLFAHDVPGQRLSCGSCHMQSSEGQAATSEGSPLRSIHDHAMVGVDTALVDGFPGQAEGHARVQAALDPSLSAKLCVTPPQGGANVKVTLDNSFAGHGFPSGAAYDRRVWLELVAYDKQGAVVWSTGKVADGASPLSQSDPDLMLFRTKLIGEKGIETHFNWQAVTALPSLLPPAVTNDPADPAYYHSVTREFLVPSGFERLTMRVRFAPFDPMMLDDLVASGDLDPAVAARVPVFTLGGTVREWTSDMPFGCQPLLWPRALRSSQAWSRRDCLRRPFLQLDSRTGLACATGSGPESRLTSSRAWGALRARGLNAV